MLSCSVGTRPGEEHSAVVAPTKDFGLEEESGADGWVQERTCRNSNLSCGPVAESQEAFEWLPTYGQGQDVEKAILVMGRIVRESLAKVINRSECCENDVVLDVAGYGPVMASIRVSHADGARWWR